MIEYKESDKYQMALGYAVVIFLVKEKIKKRRMLQRAHNIYKEPITSL